MDLLFSMNPAQAAALSIGVLIIQMMLLKGYVGAQRRRHKLASGETNADFARAQRVQLNAVEDVPPLLVGIAGLALLGMPAWYIHIAGLILILSRAAHAFGLAGSGGFSWGRLLGTLGTFIVAFMVAGALIFHALAPPAH